VRQDRNEWEEIETVCNDWLAAEGRKDTGKLLTLVTDDAVFLPTNSAPVVGKQAIEATYRTFFDQFNVVEHRTSILEIRVTNDWAVVLGSEKLLLTPKTSGVPAELNGHGMSILQRDARGVWRFARGLNNLSPKSAGISSKK
jgi:uncharacterized protein (TIGR02246 family)